MPKPSTPNPRPGHQTQFWFRDDVGGQTSGSGGGGGKKGGCLTLLLIVFAAATVYAFAVMSGTGSGP